MSCYKDCYKYNGKERYKSTFDESCIRRIATKQENVTTKRYLAETLVISKVIGESMRRNVVTIASREFFQLTQLQLLYSFHQPEVL
jgi:hypothetical protein